MHFGIDVSSNNIHPLNASALASWLHQCGQGAQPFAIVKITQGTGYVNPDAVGDLAMLRGAGFALAGYLMDEGNADVVAEEALYRKVAGVLPQTNDIELPDGLSPVQYAAHVAELVAQDPGALDYLNQSEVAEDIPTASGLWLAQYNGAAGSVAYPSVIHQFSDNATIPGCAGQFDLDAWLGSETQFATFFGLAPIPAPWTFGGDMPQPNDVVDEWEVPGTDGGAYFELHADGGLFAYGGAVPTDLEYVAVANDGTRYHFGPSQTPGIFSYPGLPPEARQGTRYFVAMEVLAYAGQPA